MQVRRVYRVLQEHKAQRVTPAIRVRPARLAPKDRRERLARKGPKAIPVFKESRGQRVQPALMVRPVLRVLRARKDQRVTRATLATPARRVFLARQAPPDRRDRKV